MVAHTRYECDGMRGASWIGNGTKHTGAALMTGGPDPSIG